MVNSVYTKLGSWVFDPKRGDYVFKECGNITVSFPNDNGFVKFKDYTNSRPLDFKGENKPTYDLLKPVYNGETSTNLDKVRGLIPCDGVDWGKGVMLDPKEKKRKEPYWKKLPRKGKKGRKNWEV